MKPSLFLIGVALMIFLALEPSSSAQDLVFVGVNVVPMDRNRTLNNQTVIVQDGRIAQVGPVGSTRVPDGALRLEGRGKYLMPGLGEMHGHIPSPLEPREFTESVLFLYVANGVTTVRGMQGSPGQLDLRERAKRGELLAPNLYLAGPAFSGKTIKSVDEAIQRVRQQKTEGWDLLKVLPGLARDHYDAMARTAKEVGISFAGHVPADVGLLHAIQSGQETFDHLDGYIEYLQGDKGPVTEARLQEITKLTREAGVWVVPTMALWETLRGTADLATLRALPELRYAPLQQIQQWTSAQENLFKNPDFKPDVARHVIQNRARLLKVLSDGGVKILLGSDAPQRFSVPGFSLHREMRRMADAGMKPYDILRSGTYNVGLYLKEKDNFGTIEVGKRADLILLDANPLEDISNIARRSGVMVRGRWLSEREIQSRLDQIAASHR
ncbi:MAG TPA: amidohydrolase family protein [Candidatus Binatia bacterium]|nr:amidohydrolase family protein [Candidatus Binatia bacterium]